ncbi:hypothetical protein ANN_27235 [Periplaneta americana]|uniref:Endonuclease/exonuclease/phosphatase domain-containing protein n=1 Tax=Periplaneta americana TaxID=6978 RepID=A0ABQ8RXL5_PERAM|nr:hypothetical protein ANN_27235 [Periplaneta americana]
MISALRVEPSAERHPITDTAGKAWRVLHFVMRVLRKGSDKSKEIAYKSLVRPVMEYGAACWDPYRLEHIQTLEKIKKRALKCCRNNSPLEWDTLTDRRTRIRLCALFKTYRGEPAWREIKNRLQQSNYSSRNDHSYKLRERRQRTDTGKFSFLNRTIRDWNALPADLLKALPITKNHYSPSSHPVETFSWLEHSTFYAHIAQMSIERLTARIFVYLLGSKSERAWTKEVERGIQEVMIIQEDIQEYELLKKKLKSISELPTEERKDTHRIPKKGLFLYSSFFSKVCYFIAAHARLDMGFSLEGLGRRWPIRSGPPAWGLGEGLTTHHRKKQLVTKPNKKPRNGTDSPARPQQRNKVIRFGTWNVTSLYRTGGVTLVAKELARYRIDFVGVQEVRRLRWAGHVARMGESRNAYRVLVGRPEGKRPLGRPRRRWGDNIKMDLREVGYDGRDWINLAQDRDQWRAYVRAAMTLRVP